MKNQLNLTVAIKDGVFTCIDEVERGLKCGCVCPACREALVAKKGPKVQHHFAHYSGKNCEYGYESSLHLMAKEVLSKAKRIMLPPVYVSFPNSYKPDELIAEPKEVSIDKVELELHLGDMVPDVVVYSGGKRLFIEVFVTHLIDDKKLEKIKREGVSTLEINLSKKNTLTSMEELETLLLNESEEKCWKYNSLANKYYHAFCQIAEERNIVQRGFSSQVDDCPIRVRSWRGKSYASFMDDCIYCEYCISAEHDKILCSGRLRISSIHDLRTKERLSMEESNARIREKQEKAILAGECPMCGGKLLRRQSKYGFFLGCENYPDCYFTVSINAETGEIVMD